MVDTSISPYELVKDITSKVFTFKSQNITLVTLLFLFQYKHIFHKDFITLKNYILRIFPYNVIDYLQAILVPMLNLLFFIGFIGMCISFVIIILAGLNEKLGWFETFMFNYSYYFQGNKKGLIDNLVEKLILLPVNFAIIISGICFLFDNTKIKEYYSNMSFLHASLFGVQIFYTIAIVSFFMHKVKDY